jgi:hypothetical protein
MIYHKNIELNGWEPATNQIYQYVKEKTHYLDQPGFFWNTLPEKQHKACYKALAPVFESAGFELLRITFLIISGPSVEIHADRVDNSKQGYPGCSARVNIPVLNCEHSETRFYSPLKWDPVIKTLSNGIEYEYHREENCKLEASTIITKPTVLRVRELHNVVVHKPIYPRITLTCLLDPDPVYLLEEN